MQAGSQSPVSTVAVMKFSALGDIAIQLPFLRAMNKPFCIITSPIGKAFLEDEFSDFIILRNKSLMSHLKLAYQIRKRCFTDLIDLQGNDRCRFFTRISGSTIHNGYDINAPYGLPYSDWVKQIKDEAKSRTSFHAKERTYIVFNTGSSPRWTSKRLPVHKWVEFAGILNEQYGLPIKLTGSGDEVDYINSVAKQLPGDIEVVAGKTGLTELKTLLGNAFLTVSTDSAALHISTVQGTPSIGIFGATPWFDPPYLPWMTCIYDHTYYPSGERPPAQPEIRNYYDQVNLLDGLGALKDYIS